MGVFIVYSVVVLVMTVFFIGTVKYKRKVFLNLDKRKHKFKLIYGTTAVIIDIFNKYIHKVNYEKIKSKLSKMNVSKPNNIDIYIELISMTAVSVFVFYLVVIFGYFICVKNYFTEEKNILTITRPEYGEGEKTYSIILKDGNKEEKINVDVSERIYTREEAYEIITKSYPNMIKEFLGENEALDNVTEDLNFIASLDNGISIQWEIENMELIDYFGNILWLSIEEKESTKVLANMSLGDYSQSYEIELIINKSERDKKKLISEELDKIIKEENVEKKLINIKEVADKYEVRFLDKKDKQSLKYIIYALLIAIVIYIAKEKEGEKELDKRRDEIDLDYAQIITKFTILQSAGLNTINAWNKIIEDYEKQKRDKRFAYEEMKYAAKRMKSGFSEGKAYLEFGRRCGTHSYIKFANLLEQNLKKGAKGMKGILEAEVREALEERKVLARRKGDMAGTKLLLPMGIMLIISIVVIIVPALMSVNI